MLARINRNYVPAYWDDFFNDSFFNSSNNYAAKAQHAPVNVIESDKNYLIEVAVPGLDRKELNINIEDDVLTISSEIRDRKEKKEPNYLRREFQSRAFKRSFTLPETIDTDHISARHEDGILSVVLPKKEEVVQKISRHIEVK